MSPSLRAALALVPALIAQAAAAQDVSAANPAGVADALQALGYQARLEADTEGDPMIRSSIEGVNYRVYFYGCNDDHHECKYLQLSAGFDLDNGITLDRINDWNRNKIVASAYIDDDNDPYLKYFVTTVGGISRENFEDVVDWWRVAISQFKEHIDF